MKFLFIVIALLAAFASACNFQPGVEYTCIPCGGIYSCRGDGTCVANDGTVPGCNLPSGALEWFCCETDVCNVNAQGMCSYTPPGLPPGMGGGGGTFTLSLGALIGIICGGVVVLV